MCSSSSIAVALGRELKLCAFNGGLDVHLFILASLFGLVLLAGLLFAATRLVTTKVALVSLGVFVHAFTLWSMSSSWVSGKVQLLAGLCSLCTVWFGAQSALLERTVASLLAQVVSLQDTLRFSNERAAALSAELREVQAAISVKDNIIRDLQAVTDLDDNTVYDPDTTLAVGNSDIDEVFAALSALRAEVAENTSLLTNARNARETALEAKNESDARVDQLRVCQHSTRRQSVDSDILDLCRLPSRKQRK